MNVARCVPACLLTLLVGFAARAAAAEDADDAAKKAIVGTWRSVEIEGLEKVFQVVMTFESDGDFRGEVTVKVKDQEEKEQVEGKWRIEKDELTIIVKGREDASKFSLSGDKLVVMAPEGRGKIVFQRVKTQPRSP